MVGWGAGPCTPMVQLDELQKEREAASRAEAEQNAAEEAELRRRYENEAAKVKSLLARAEQRARTLAAEEDDDHQAGSSSAPTRDGRTTLRRCVYVLVDVLVSKSLQIGWLQALSK